MFLAGKWYALDFCRPRAADGSRASSLDVALLQQHGLGPLLKIGDVRTDKRIDFVGGAGAGLGARNAVNSHTAAVAFSMPPSPSTTDGISDEGGIMPPKSTWFEPSCAMGS